MENTAIKPTWKFQLIICQSKQQKGVMNDHNESAKVLGNMFYSVFWKWYRKGNKDETNETHFPTQPRSELIKKYIPQLPVFSTIWHNNKFHNPSQFNSAKSQQPLNHNLWTPWEIYIYICWKCIKTF